jgi:hypothetical protein
MATQNILSADRVERMHFGRCERSRGNGGGVISEDFKGIVGSSDSLLEVLDLVRVVAPTDSCSGFPILTARNCVLIRSIPPKLLLYKPSGFMRRFLQKPQKRR